MDESSDTKRSRPVQHESGDFGERFVAYHLPSSWVVHEYKGSEDYGIDFHVEIFEEGEPTGLEFGIQVKSKNRKIEQIHYISVSRGNLSYIAAKPYPTIAVAVSRPDKKAAYVWFQEALSTESIMQEFYSRNGSKKIRIPIDSKNNFLDAERYIVEYLSNRNEQVNKWLSSIARTNLIGNIFIDINSALNVLIECDAMLHKGTAPNDEASYKLTFSFSLLLTTYGQLYHLTKYEKLIIYGPLATTIVGLRNSFRGILSEIVWEKSLLQIEDKEERPKSDFQIAAAKFSGFPDAIPRLLPVLRDLLRTLLNFMIPHEQRISKLSHWADNIIEYRTEIKTGEESKSGQEQSNKA